jgi:hypothetical protein
LLQNYKEKGRKVCVSPFFFVILHPNYSKNAAKRALIVQWIEQLSPKDWWLFWG